MKRLIKNTIFVIGTVILSAYFIIAVFGPYIAPYSPYKTNLAMALRGPTREHLFGTDSLGRDLLSRVIEGARYSLFMALSSIAVCVLLGIMVGIVTAYYDGSWLDNLLTGITEIFIGVPIIIMAIVVVSILPSRIIGLMVAIVVVYTPTMIRLVRSKALAVKEESYVEAVIALGASKFRIMFHHILRNSLTPIIVESTLRAGEAVILIAALSYIGLGVSPPTPEWGVLLSRGRDYMFTSPHIVVLPGIALSLLILGFNLFGEGFRDILMGSQ